MFWGDAVLYAVHILNRSPTRANAKRASPLEVLTGKTPNLRGIVVFGSHARGAPSLSSSSAIKPKGYKVLLPRDNKVVVTQRIKNIETLTEAQNAKLQRAMDVGDRAGGQEDTDAPAAAVANDGRAEGNRATQAAARQEETAASGEVVNAAFEHDPLNYGQAMRSGKREEWEKAMQEEIAALEANDVWTITRRTAGQHALHIKWFYKSKTDAQGDLEWLKARLVACGNELVLNVDYTLTFAAVMDLSTFKVILALAATCGVTAKHGDIPNAYVKADKEPHLRIYLQMPHGMPVSKETLRAQGVSNASELVLELRKSLYRLKQAGRLWIQLLQSKLSTAGFTRCLSDMCFYWKRDGDDLVVVGVYVDDLLATGTSAAAVERFFASLASLSVKDLGCVSKFLGMRVTHYGPTVRQFQSLVGSLLWVARCLRPDIVFAVHKFTRRAHAPRLAVWKLAKRITQYLKSTAALKVTMIPEDNLGAAMRLEAFSGADFATDKTDRKSMTGGIVMLNEMAVSWVARELLGLREMLCEVGVEPALPMQLRVDNQAAIAQIAGEASSLKAKRVDVRLKFLCDYSRRGIITASYVRSEQMLADLLTKALDTTKLSTLRALVRIG
uniref:Reverse transcriptase Ty1/copia-type domain-containing protein n=1 Tax=Peronospora matthiolae TaxID=2874970 RepID=A0AAV1T2Z2_9STRA